MTTSKKKTKRRPGRPKGSKNVKRSRRPRKKAGRPKAVSKGNTITLPVGGKPDIKYWSDMVVFLNANAKKSFIVEMDASEFRLVAQ